ncbi:hypothetical protein, partial [Klebsiella pneumoniae]|uniref:hypothetical protein n=1 Tax=Klebsiella pneumoniae TaxID=573 RepID=UPI0030088619
MSFVPGIDGPVEGYPTENVGRSTIKGIETEVRWLPVRTTELSADVQYADSRYDQFAFQTPDISGFVGAPPGTVGPVSGCPHQLSNTA